MSDTPAKASGRVTLTKKQIEEGAGRELAEVVNNALADGQLERAELDSLKEWLQRHAEEPVPAIRFLGEEIDRCVSDGVIHPWELGRVQLALERILPVSDRAFAKEARKKREAEMAAKEALEPPVLVEERVEGWSNIRAANRAKWESCPPTDAQREFVKSLGGELPPDASKFTASELIDKLLAQREGKDPGEVAASNHDAALKKATENYAQRTQGQEGKVIFQIPDRQPYEGKATMKQKDLLWRVGFQDQAILDSLGKWQASALIDQVKAHVEAKQSSSSFVGVIFIAVIVVVGILLTLANY